MGVRSVTGVGPAPALLVRCRSQPATVSRMISPRERRAAALEAIAQALLELAAVEREPEDVPLGEVLVNRRNCAKELGLAPTAFVEAAGREFQAFRVSRTITAKKADVLAWLQTRKVKPRSVQVAPSPGVPVNMDDFLRAVERIFARRVGRAMTDDELNLAEISADPNGTIAAQLGCKPTPDDLAKEIQSKIGQSRYRHDNWRKLGLDPAALERKGEELRTRLRQEHPEMDWRARMEASREMWSNHGPA